MKNATVHQFAVLFIASMIVMGWTLFAIAERESGFTSVELDNDGQPTTNGLITQVGKKNREKETRRKRKLNGHNASPSLR